MDQIKKRAHVNRSPDMSGKRFGMLTVIEKTGSYSKKYKSRVHYIVNLKCICDCGEEVIRTRIALLRGCKHFCDNDKCKAEYKQSRMGI